MNLEDGKPLSISKSPRVRIAQNTSFPIYFRNLHLPIIWAKLGKRLEFRAGKHNSTTNQHGLWIRTDNLLTEKYFLKKAEVDVHSGSGER